MAKCVIKHAKCQPTDEQWKCPKCGADCEFFYIGEPAENTDDCSLLHDEDSIYCTKCSYGVSGKTFSRIIQRKLNLVECPHCKGRGLVSKGKD